MRTFTQSTIGQADLIWRKQVVFEQRNSAFYLTKNKEIDTSNYLDLIDQDIRERVTIRDYERISIEEHPDYKVLHFETPIIKHRMFRQLIRKKVPELGFYQMGSVGLDGLGLDFDQLYVINDDPYNILNAEENFRAVTLHLHQREAISYGPALSLLKKIRARIQAQSTDELLDW
jgi:hypothetical protein